MNKSYPFPDSYLISFLLNLTYTTILNWVRPYPHAQSSSSGTQQDHMKKCQIALNLRTVSIPARK